jgi:hypothetical protein
MWINSSWPLAKQVTRALSTDPLEAERVQVQEIYRESVNRIQGSLEALFSRDHHTAAQHLLDALVVLTHHMADMEARRWAAHTGDDALSRRRVAIQQGAGGSSVRDVMYALSKRESSMQSFFHRTGSSGHQQTPVQSQIYSTPVSSNPFPSIAQQPFTTPTPAQVQSMGGTVQPHQSSGGGRHRRYGRLFQGAQSGRGAWGSQGGQGSFGNYHGGDSRGTAFVGGTTLPSVSISPNSSPPIQTLPNDQ